VRPHERGIVMYTLHHAAEIRSIDTVDELDSVASRVKPVGRSKVLLHSS
jgi:non-homologous end joining protein Ku